MLRRRWRLHTNEKEGNEVSKGGGGGGSTTTVQKADPWVGLQPGLNALYSNAVTQFNQGAPQYYPGQTYAGSNDNIDQAMYAGSQRAHAGSPLVNMGKDRNAATISGDYLNSYDPRLAAVADGSFLNQQNPQLAAMYKSATDPMVEQFKNATMPGLASQFSMAGRMGSNSHMAAAEGAGNSLARGLGSASAQIYGTNFENERQRQMQAMQGLSQNRNYERGLQQQAIGMAPQLAASDYNDLDKLMGIGQYQQQQQQQGIDADRARFDYGQQRPSMALQQLNQILQGGMSLNGSTSSGKNSMNRNPFAGALGGAASLYGLGSVMGGPAGAMLGGPVGMLGGALLGGLFG